METSAAGRKIEPAYLAKAITYQAYTALFASLLAQDRTTGPDQSAAMVHFTQLNQQRMHRLDKVIELLPETVTLIRGISLPQTWLVLTEAWCGDAAQSVPVMHAVAALNPLIELKLLLRDENLGLMDQYLTNGVSRSIPKLIGVDTTTSEELFVWGPRPAPLQEIFMQLKAEGMEFHQIKEELQRWYNKDKTVTIQQELSTAASGVAGASVGMIA
jgi:Thioredoxin